MQDPAVTQRLIKYFTQKISEGVNPDEYQSPVQTDFLLPMKTEDNMVATNHLINARSSYERLLLSRSRDDFHSGQYTVLSPQTSHALPPLDHSPSHVYHEKLPKNLTSNNYRRGLSEHRTVGAPPN